MTKEKILGVIALYRKYFEGRNIPKKDFPEDKPMERVHPVERLSKCHSMLDKMEGFIEEDRLDKVQRWLGFIQGVLWADGYYTLEDLKHHSMTGGEERG